MRMELAHIASLAHKVYLEACWENCFITMFIAWAAIVSIEDTAEV